MVDAVGGQLNAFTAKECTCYYIKLLDSHTELGMDVLSDMLLSSRFAPEDIEREKGVVLEEVNLYEDSPDELIHDLHYNHLWGDDPLGRNILGTVSSIEGLGRHDILDYCQDFYTPDNLVLAAAGNLDHDQIVAMTEKYFEKFAGKRRVHSFIKPCLHTGDKTIHKDTEQVHLCLGTTSVAQDDPRVYTAHLLNTILGGGVSSRLFQSIREERGLAYSVYSYFTSYSDTGTFNIYAGTREENASVVLELIEIETAKVRAGEVRQAELDSAKEQLKGSLLLGLETSSSRMSRIGKNEITLGKSISLPELVAKIDAVSMGDIHAMAAELLDPSHLCRTALGPVGDNLFGKGR